MEQLKWNNPDMPQNDVLISYIRMLAGPLDYTPGAMRNASKDSFPPNRRTTHESGHPLPSARLVRCV